MTGLPQIIVSPGAWGTFIPYSGLHIAAVSICALVVVALTMAGRILRNTHETALRCGLGIFGLLYWISYNVWWDRHAPDLAAALPLHICDLNGVIAPLALLTLNRWLRATCYFLDLRADDPGLHRQPDSLLVRSASSSGWFWAQHTIIIACAVHDIAVLGFRPNWRDLGRAYAVSAIYLTTDVPVNFLLGTNYGYIGNPLPPEKIPPFIDALGPWPLRAIIVVVLAAIGFALVQLPWLIRKSAAGQERLRTSACAIDFGRSDRPGTRFCEGGLSAQGIAPRVS